MRGAEHGRRAPLRIELVIPGQPRLLRSTLLQPRMGEARVRCLLIRDAVIGLSVLLVRKSCGHAQLKPIVVFPVHLPGNGRISVDVRFDEQSWRDLVLTFAPMTRFLPLLLLLSFARTLAADDLPSTLSTANFNQCPRSLWPTEKTGQVPPGVAQLRVLLGPDGKVLETALSAPGTNAALDRESQRAVQGCVADAALFKRGAGWYNLRYVWGLQPSVKGLEREAMREIMDDAVNGDVESQLTMAMQYRSSKRFVDDGPEAFAWLVRSAQSGSADAQLALAIAYVNGDGVAKNHAKATLWFGRAAQAGKTVAQYLYAVQLEFGVGTKVDIPAALMWYSKAAGGSAEAKKRLRKESR